MTTSLPSGLAAQRETARKLKEVSILNASAARLLEDAMAQVPAPWRSHLLNLAKYNSVVASALFSIARLMGCSLEDGTGKETVAEVEE